MRAQRERETRTRRVHYRKQGSVDAGKRTRRSKSGRPTREEIERRGREGRKKYAATEAGEGRKWQVRWGRSPEKTRKRRRLVGGDRRRRQGVRRRKARTEKISSDGAKLERAPHRGVAMGPAQIGIHVGNKTEYTTNTECVGGWHRSRE